MDEFTFFRDSKEISGRRIGAGNLDSLAIWCGGEVKTKPGDPTQIFIQINDDDLGFPGDWIIHSDDKFWGYSDEETLAVFAPFFTQDHKFDRIQAIVKKALLEQDSATYHGTGLSTSIPERAGLIAREIMKLL